MIHQRRRQSDQSTDRIYTMIEQEEDPKVRGLLTTLQIISEKLIDTDRFIDQHTLAINNLSDSVLNHQKHIDSYYARLPLLLWVLAIVQAGLFAGGSYVFNSMDILKRDVYNLQVKVADTNNNLQEHIDDMRGIKR